jgi:cell division transport system permease protein
MIARHFRRALEDTLANRFVNAVTIMTIALTVMIVSAALLVFLNAGDWMSAWQQGTRIMAYLRPAAGGAAPALRHSIESIEGVHKAQFIPRDEALHDLKARMEHPASLFENLLENPLPDAFEIQLKPSNDSWEQIEAVADRVRSLAEVEDVEYGRQWIVAVRRVAHLFQTLGLALLGLLLVAAIAIVANTTRLVIYSRQDEVEIMRLVGATERFIQAPFLIEGLLQGLIGAVGGIGILFAAFSALAVRIDQNGLAGVVTLRFLSLEQMALITMASMLVGWLGCYVALKQFLKL